MDYGSSAANALLGGVASAPGTSATPAKTSTTDYGSAAANTLLGGKSAATTTSNYGSPAANTLLGSSSSTIPTVPNKPLDLSTLITKTQPTDLSGIFNGFLKQNSFSLPSSVQQAPIASASTPAMPSAPGTDIVNDTMAGLPAAASTVSKSIYDKVIGGPAELLSNTTADTRAAAALNNGNKFSQAGQEGLQLVSQLGLGVIKGLTFNAVSPDSVTQKEGIDSNAISNQVASGLGNILGAVGGISLVAKGIDAIPAVGKIVQTLNTFVGRYPLVAKYIAPYIGPLISNTGALAISGQLDPALADNFKARATTLLTDLGTAPLYTALGMIKNPLYALPPAFGLGFGMAKLSGASNKDAVTAGTLFAFLQVLLPGEASGKAQDAADVLEQNQNEALDLLNTYSDTTLTKDSTPKEIKDAYYKAAHQTHPDVGGAKEDFQAVQNAYDVLTKGAVSKNGGKPTDAETSVKLLSNEVSDSVEKNGAPATHQALMDNLGVDEPTATRLVIAATRPTTPAEIKASSDEVLNTVAPTRVSDTTTSDSVRAWINQGTPIPEHIMTGLEATHPGVDELTFNKDNEITLYRDQEPKAGQIESYSTTPKAGQEPYVVNKSDVVANLSSNAMKETFSRAYPGKDVQSVANKDMLAKYSKLEGEVLVKSKEKENPEEVTTSKQFEKLPREEQEKVFPTLSQELQQEITGMTNEDLAKGEKPIISDILSGKQKIQIPDSIKSEVMTRVGKGNYMRIFRTAPGFSTLDEIANDNGFKSDEDLLNEIESGLNARKAALQGGFINPGKVLSDIATKVKEVTDLVNKDIEAAKLTGNVNEAIYQHEGMRAANRQRLITLVDQIGNELTAKGWEDLYHYDENKSEPISESEKKIYDEVITPLKDALTAARAQYRELGGVITTDLQNEMTPRFAKEKGGPIDRLLQKGKNAKKTLSNGSLLSQSVGSGSKSREYHVAVDANGKRTVVHIPGAKGENVTAFNNGELTNLGSNKKVISPRTKEFFDKNVTPVLEKVARDLGVVHETALLKGKKAGISLTGQKKVITHPGAPERVLIHEIGHQVDEKYGMQAIFSKDDARNYGKDTMKDEQRAVADLRIGDGDVKPSFKSYVRKGEEKMAAMFEAYLHVPEQFQEVAPNLYEKFDEFLGSHPELAPIRDIEKSLELGMKKTGGQHIGGISRGNFVSSEGKQYKIEQATTKEIEANTTTRYHKNVLANYIVSYDRTLNALNAMKLLERIKNTPEFGEIIKKDDPDEAPPEKWESVGDVLPQFRGYHMEPRLAEALQDLASRQKGQTHFPVLDEVNNFLTSAIVFNPIMHLPNVIQGFGMTEANTGVIPGLTSKSRANFITALNEVKNKGPLYLSYIEHGAPFMGLKETTKNFSEAILTQYTDEVEKAPTEFDQIAKVLNYANPVAWIKGMGKINTAITWGGNDVFFMHALLDHADATGGTMEDSIRTISKRMADYRIPSRIFVPGKTGRALSKTLQSRAFMFARYHYSGVIKPWIETVKDAAGTKKTAHERIAGIRSLAYLALMGMIIYPYIDKLIKGMTGNQNSYLTMSGPVKIIQNAENLASAGVSGISGAVQATATLSPVMTALIELGFNTDMYTRNPIYGPMPAEGMTSFGTSMVAPLSSADRMTPSDFALSMFGIYSPKNSSGKTALDAQKYDELPVLEIQVKKDLAAGLTDKANAEMKDFNDRAIANYNQDMLQTGGQPLPKDGSQNEAFLKQWGIKAPGAKAMANASKTYGDGSLTSKSSILSTISTYAKAMAVSPIEAFHLMFSGQTIKQVDNFSPFSGDSAIIVQRASLSTTEKVKGDQASADGDTTTKGLQLDHVIPLEAGGTNDASNLNLITTEQDGGDQQKLEDTLGSAVKAGKISQANVREYTIRFKATQMPGEILPDAMMQEFKDKYGSKPMTLSQINLAISSGEAK